MIQRSAGLPPFTLSATRVGRTDLGPSVATLDDDVLAIAVGGRGESPPVRVRLAAIDTIELAGDAVSLALADGTHIAVEASNAAELRDELLARCRTVPELTRTLRAFGSRRGRPSTRASRASEAEDQRRFFDPLIEARKKAGRELAPQHVVAAFDAAALEQSLADVMRRFAAEREAEPGPARRALEAELDDASEPLVYALRDVGRASAVLSADLENVRAWREWSSHLRVAFETADRVWLAVDAALDGVISDI
jgi:hypothetical protein